MVTTCCSRVAQCIMCNMREPALGQGQAQNCQKQLSHRGPLHDTLPIICMRQRHTVTLQLPHQFVRHTYACNMKRLHLLLLLQQRQQQRRPVLSELPPLAALHWPVCYSCNGETLLPFSAQSAYLWYIHSPLLQHYSLYQPPHD